MPVGAAPVSKNRLGLSRGSPASMGIVAARLFDVARCEVAGRGHAGALIGMTTCCRVRSHGMDRVRGGVCRVRHTLCGGQCGARHALAGAVFGVAWQDRAGGWRRALVHELSHQNGAWRSGRRCSSQRSCIWPPQSGQAPRLSPVRPLMALAVTPGGGAARAR